MVLNNNFNLFTYDFSFFCCARYVRYFYFSQYAVATILIFICNATYQPKNLLQYPEFEFQITVTACPLCESAFRAFCIGGL